MTLCAVCELPISPEESFGQAMEVRHQHLYPDQCIRLLRAENAALREDKARLVEALERICTHSRDADCGDHCSNACMYCQARAAIDATRKAAR